MGHTSTPESLKLCHRLGGPELLNQKLRSFFLTEQFRVFRELRELSCVPIDGSKQLNSGNGIDRCAAVAKDTQPPIWWISVTRLLAAHDSITVGTGGVREVHPRPSVHISVVSPVCLPLAECPPFAPWLGQAFVFADSALWMPFAGAELFSADVLRHGSHFS